jgi:N6-L-threonylcarbamoyladenine synthase
LGFPGGPKIAQLAEKSKHEKYIELPYSIKGMDVSFSGILTKVRQMIEQKKANLEDLSFSLQETAFAMLIEASERAIAHTGKKELLLGGGVACNKRLQEMCNIMCNERNEKVKFFCPDNSLLTDNGAMIAYLGEIMFNSGIKIKPNSKEFDNLDILPRQRTDDVVVDWR